MDMIIFVLLAVVFLAQTALFTLFFLEKHRYDRKNRALLSYIDEEISKLKKEHGECLEKITQNIQNAISDYDKKNAGDLNEINEKIRDLALDYAEAQEAAGKVNSYASSLAHIFDYDPVAASKRNRKKELG
jgi:hypothetical protein